VTNKVISGNWERKKRNKTKIPDNQSLFETDYRELKTGNFNL